MQETPSAYDPPKAPLTEPDPSLGVPKLEVTWGRTTAIWWSLVWRTYVFTQIAGVMLGVLSRILVGITGWKVETIDQVGLPLSVIVAIPISMRVAQFVLDKKFREFAIAHLNPSTGRAEWGAKWGTTWRRTLAIWWSFAWRFAPLYLVAAGLATNSLSSALSARAVQPQAIIVGIMVLRWLIALPLGVLVLRSVLRKKVRTLTIRLIPSKAIERLGRVPSPAETR